MQQYHTAVMVSEVLSGLNLHPDGVYVDLTFGGGTHSRAICEKLRDGLLIAFDQDADAAENVPEDERVLFIPQNFKYFRNYLKYLGYPQVDGILADLGVSSHHFDSPERGFSFRFKGPLDMRMNTHAEKTAADILNTYGERELEKLLAQYGEVRNARRLTEALLQYRKQQKFAETTDLVEALEAQLPKNQVHKFLARVFQALRIEVNDEIAALQRFLENAPAALKTGGRLVVITYHSLEDRLVKNFIKRGTFSGEAEKDFYGNVHVPFKAVVSKAITPSQEEVRKNNRARSAKLRIAERL